MEWADVYRAALPEVLRPDPMDSRFRTAAWQAERNGWPADVIAERVAADNYDSARNPVLIALMRMESAARLSPDTPAPPQTCTACEHGWIDPDVVTTPVPQQWLRDQPNPNPPTYTSTRPCPTCRPELAARVAELPPPGQRRNAGTPTVPPEFIRERVELLLELARTPDLTEEEREDCMRVLIAVQRRRLNPV